MSGEEVETVLGMLLCSRFPDAVRVRPSQGDSGLDVSVPVGESGSDKGEVFQIKRFCSNLVSSQNRQIKQSCKRVVDASKKDGWRITKWHLVMPLDPASQNLGWLDELTKDADFPCETNGLIFCNTLRRASAAATPAITI